MLHQLQWTLATIHQGTNTDFIENLTDLEENRDEELLRLSLQEKYERECVEREFQLSVEQINEEHDRIIKLAKEKLYGKLERQIKRHKEDKALIDVANDHSYFLNSSYSSRSNGNTSETPGSPKLSSFYSHERRNLRKRGLGGLSSNYDDSGDGGSSSKQRRTRRTNGYQSGTGGGSGHNNSEHDDFISDHDSIGELLFGETKQTSTRNKVSQGVSSLKSEDVDYDIQLMKSAIASIKGIPHTK